MIFFFSKEKNISLFFWKKDKNYININIIQQHIYYNDINQIYIK